MYRSFTSRIAPGAGNGGRAFPSLKPEAVDVTATPADEFLAEIEAIRRLNWAMQPLSRTDPHAFVEDKDAVDRRLDRLATRFRVRFCGTPVKFSTGTVRGPTGRRVQVERRRDGRSADF